MLQRGSNSLGLRQLGLQLIKGAFTNKTDAASRGWAARFPTGGGIEGRESVGLGALSAATDADAERCTGSGCATQSVPLYVLDDHVQREGLQYIDVLSIDTEGHDALVLQGGINTLAKGVGYVEFEYHYVGPWASIRLQDVLALLHGFGFVCYWLGKGKLWRITGCWHPAYEAHQWSNVGCVHTSQVEWYRVMEQIFNETVDT